MNKHRFWDAFICWFHLKGGRLSPGKQRTPASGRQPWVAPGEDELFGEPVPQRDHPDPIQPAFSMSILQQKPVLRPQLDTPQSRSARAARPLARRTFSGPAENVGPAAFRWRLGVSRRAPGHTRSPAGAARSARAAGPWWWARRCSPQARI